MSKGRRIITAGGEPTKKVNAPVIVTTNGREIVHEDAVTQVPKSVANEIISGDVDPDVTDKGGTHTLTGNHIMGNGDRVEDNPSKETPTQSVIDRIITGETEATPTRDEGVASVTNHVVTGEIANTATDNGAPQVQNITEVIEDEQAAQNVTQLFSFSNTGNGGDYQADMPAGQGVWVIGMGTTDTTTGSSTNAVIVPYNTAGVNGLWLVVVTDSTYYFEVEINNYSAFQYQAAEFDLF